LQVRKETPLRTKVKWILTRFSDEKFKKIILSGQINISDKFETDKTIRIIWSKLNLRFLDYFNEGFDLFISGEW